MSWCKGWVLLCTILLVAASDTTKPLLQVKSLAEFRSLAPQNKHLVLSICAQPGSPWLLPDPGYQEHVTAHTYKNLSQGWHPPQSQDPCEILHTVMQTVAASPNMSHALFAEAIITPGDWQLLDSLGASNVPAVFWYESSKLREDIGRSFYLRTGFPVHYIHPLELEFSLMQLTVPVGRPYNDPVELRSLIANDLDDEDGELGSTLLVLRWPGMNEKGVKELAEFLQAWQHIFQVAVAQPSVFQKALRSSSAVSAMIVRPDRSFEKFEGPIRGLPRWLQQNAMQIAMPFPKDNSYLGAVKALKFKPLLHLFLPQPSESRLSVFRRVAEEFSYEFNSALVTPDYIGGVERFDQYRRSLGLTLQDEPGVAILGMGEGQKFAFNGEINTRSLEQFCRAYIDGSMEPSVMSSRSSESQINAIDLRDLLSNPTSDPMLVVFCTETNPHCKAAQSKLLKVMSEVKQAAEHSRSKLSIRTFDPATNDLPIRFNASGVRVWGNYNIPSELLAMPFTGFHYFRYFNIPAIYLVGAGQVKRYVGGMDPKKILDFAAEKSVPVKSEL